MSQPETIHSRAEAKALGLKKYFTGKPCPHGHNDYREIGNGKCVACSRAFQQTEKGKESRGRWNKTEAGRAYSKAYGELHKERRRNQRLQRDYGITTDEYNAMLASQDNKCAICCTTFDPSDRLLRPNIDHNHTTKKVRAILCHGCNAFIGLARENVYTLKAGIDYLRRHNTDAS